MPEHGCRHGACHAFIARAKRAQEPLGGVGRNLFGRRVRRWRPARPGAEGPAPAERSEAGYRQSRVRLSRT
jgi:hypothetical protein